jgi:hypothetical protein
MPEQKWKVTLSFNMTINDAESKEEAMMGAVEHVKNCILNGEEFPMKVSARRLTDLGDQEHLFGIKW